LHFQLTCGNGWSLFPSLEWFGNVWNFCSCLLHWSDASIWNDLDFFFRSCSHGFVIVGLLEWFGNLWNGLRGGGVFPCWHGLAILGMLASSRLYVHFFIKKNPPVPCVLADASTLLDALPLPWPLLRIWEGSWCWNGCRASMEWLCAGCVGGLSHWMGSCSCAHCM